MFDAFLSFPSEGANQFLFSWGFSMPSLSNARTALAARSATAAATPQIGNARRPMHQYVLTSSRIVHAAPSQNGSKPPAVIHARYLERALDLLSAAIVFVNAESRVLRMNQAAAALMRQGDGLHLAQGALCAQTTRESQQLRCNIRCVAARSADGGSPAAFQQLVRRTEPRPPLAVTIMPLGNSSASLPEHPSAVLFVSDPEATGLPRPEALAEMYQLTRSEAELAYLLLQGKSVQQAAAARGTSTNTARSQLRSVFSKTNTVRQSDLMRALLSSPALVRIESMPLPAASLRKFSGPRVREL